MVFNIVGIKAVEGTGKKSGKPFDAYILHCARENKKDTELSGMEVKQQFIEKKFLLEDVKSLGSYKALVGMPIDISFDDGGFVDSVTLLNKGNSK